jgi:signal transduction histidine kinase
MRARQLAEQAREETHARANLHVQLNAELRALADERDRALADARSALRLREEFLAVAAHELRTPITSLRGFAQIMLRQMRQTGTVDPARLERTLEQIDRQTHHLSLLLDQLLDASRIDAGKLMLKQEPTDLAELVHAVVAQMHQLAPERTIEVSARPVSANVDRLRLEQVLTNLVDNALKFSPPERPIGIEVSTQDVSARLMVWDRGVGVPPHRRSGLFERFHQAHGEGRGGGLGLGLYLSQQIVELHGGQIRAEFPDEGGSRFVVELPGAVVAGPVMAS